jgi:twitching motility protein PilJ
VARNMQVLREISSQTADATNSTSEAIAKLAQLSASLRKSVSGFRLPDSGAAAATGKHRQPVTPDPEMATTGAFRRVSGDLNG